MPAITLSFYYYVAYASCRLLRDIFFTFSTYAASSFSLIIARCFAAAAVFAFFFALFIFRCSVRAVLYRQMRAGAKEVRVIVQRDLMRDAMVCAHDC